jgi:ATP-dependent RNA helicase DeaD
LSAPSDQTPGDSPAFSDLSLSDAVLQALRDVGYESPSPIQAATIPHLLAGTDVVGQAQTGTGKTAAFALPILSKIDIREMAPQALVLVPTRELAIQVAEAFQRYATYMKGFHVLPVYGGQSYTPQLQSLRRGVHVIVATPGRAMDHIKRGTLNLSSLRHLVLDEADEMLRMGFIDDVEWILEQAPKERQIALFSATMPPQVRRIAQHHLRNPSEVTIRSKTTTASKIRQRYWIVSGMHKLDALTRILEAEPFDAMLVFTRTKIATEELAERLSARGFAVEALNGDIVQAQRERTIARLKSSQIDIVVATDVAARGLDVERISHVVNFDVPYDPESYVHRIGRTGRAGRSGEAILFIAPRERNMLRVIERATRQPVEAMQLPTIEDVNERRVARFNEKLSTAIASGAGQMFLPLIESYERDNNVSAAEIAAALASIAQGATPLLLEASGGSGRHQDAGGERAERFPDRAASADNSRYAGKGRRAEFDGERKAPGRRPEFTPDRDTSHRAEKFAKREVSDRRAPPEHRSGPWPTVAAAEEEAVAVELPKSPNRRERRALERARREGGEGGEGVETQGMPEAEGMSAEEISEALRIPQSQAFNEFGEEVASEGGSEQPAPKANPEGTRSRAASTDKRGPRSRATDTREESPRRRPSERPGAEFDAAAEPRRARQGDDESVETYRVEVGHAHGIKPNNIVGAIANEVGLEGRFIGRVVIRDDHSFVDLPSGMPKEVFRQLQKVRVGGQQLQISRALKSHVEKLRRERPQGSKVRPKTGKPSTTARRERRK